MIIIFTPPSFILKVKNLYLKYLEKKKLILSTCVFDYRYYLIKIYIINHHTFRLHPCVSGTRSFNIPEI